jgi:hypothetical protein
MCVQFSDAEFVFWLLDNLFTTYLPNRMIYVNYQIKTKNKKPGIFFDLLLGPQIFKTWYTKTKIRINLN